MLFFYRIVMDEIEMMDDGYFLVLQSSSKK